MHRVSKVRALENITTNLWLIVHLMFDTVSHNTVAWSEFYGGLFSLVVFGGTCAFTLLQRNITKMQTNGWKFNCNITLTYWKDSNLAEWSHNTWLDHYIFVVLFVLPAHLYWAPIATEFYHSNSSIRVITDHHFSIVIFFIATYSTVVSSQTLLILNMHYHM